jgi:transposase
MTRPDGTPVNAVYGFTTMLMKLLADMDADHVAVIFDKARVSFRNDIYPQYKAHRPDPPEDLIPRFALIREAVRHFGVSASSAIRVAQRMERTGSVSPSRQGRPPGDGKLAPHADALIGWVEEQSDITTAELAEKLERERGVVAHRASLSRFPGKVGFTVKKNAAGKRERTRRVEA